MANYIALELTRDGVAEMSCIAGVGGGVPGLIRKARSAEQIIAIDGCQMACTKACLENQDLQPTWHFLLNEMGLKKILHEEFDAAEAEELTLRIANKVAGDSLPA